MNKKDLGILSLNIVMIVVFKLVNNILKQLKNVNKKIV